MTAPEGADTPSPATAPHPLSTAKYASLTTFRRTGAAVSTPVWIAPSVDGSGRLAVITVDDTGKTKRLAHTPRVELRACDIRGRVAPGTPTYAGTAHVVRGADDVALVRAAVVAKYGFTARFSDLLERATGLVGIRRNPRAGIVIDVESEPGTDSEPAQPDG